MTNLLPCPFCGSPADPEGWSSTDRSGPACTNGKCNGSADSAEAWNLRAHNSDSAEPVAVKPLKWAKDGHPWIAIMFWGLRYRIHETSGRKFILRDPLNGPEFFDTLEAAKAAAQAGYETRIRSVLASPPAKEVEITDEVYELRKAAEFLLWQYDRQGPLSESTEAWEQMRRALTNRTPDDE